MSSILHDGQRQLEDPCDKHRLADRCVAKLLRDVIDPKQSVFIESADMFFLATCDDKAARRAGTKAATPDSSASWTTAPSRSPTTTATESICRGGTR
ncbi:MAG: hypothetical protein ACREJC_01825 [Tepidisphaeraceae bacterium]